MRIEKLVHVPWKGMRTQRLNRQGKHRYWSQHLRRNACMIAHGFPGVPSKEMVFLWDDLGVLLSEHLWTRARRTFWVAVGRVRRVLMTGRLGMSCSRCAAEARPPDAAMRSGVVGAIRTSAAALGTLIVAGMQAAGSCSSGTCIPGAGSASMLVQSTPRPAT